MSVENLKDALPEYAKDLKLNLGSITRTTLFNEEQLMDPIGQRRGDTEHPGAAGKARSRDDSRTRPVTHGSVQNDIHLRRMNHDG
jgi:hypothetical protein